MTWFEEKFNNGYSGVRKPLYPRVLRVEREPLFSISLTAKIIITNVVFFLLFYILVLFFGYNFMIDNIAIKAENILAGRKIWTFFSHFWMHGGVTHLFVNMFSLASIGILVEKIIGKKRYFWFYIISGIFAALFFVLLAGFFGNNKIGEAIFGSPSTYAVGASGAIFALAGLLTILIPRMKVLVFFIIPMPLWIGIVFLLFLFWVLSIVGGLPIGNSAHLGGFIFGLFYGLYLRSKYPNKTRMIRRIFS
ncbi:MAG: rhomboid family intramembrane serine protease [Candidatus Pacearchaeota archaeon]